jgi:tRNA nucleotidyltransferase (CCA-adding enzyme)
MTEHPIQRLADFISNHGGTPILVGGAVRDMVMAGAPDPFTPTADYDIEVFGLTLPQLQDVLSVGDYHFDEVGEQFSVLKVIVPGVYDPVDISIPRYEKSTGDGHKEFEVMADPNLTFAEAARRRDFTMNSLGYDLFSETLLDPYGGGGDARAGYIRHVSDQFSEDPLRPLRAARFAARFSGYIDPGTLGVCGTMSNVAASLPSERVWTELEKVILEGNQISKFFYYLETMGWLDFLFPEVAALRGIGQDPEWHPEGDVLIHTMHALNYWAANLRTGNKEDDLVVAIAILCHDFGKVTTTAWNEEKLRITAWGHEEAGAEPTRNFLHRLRQYELANQVVPLVENHLAPVYGLSTAKSIRRLSTKVDRLDLLAIVSRADQAGRPPKSYEEGFAKIDAFELRASQLEIPVGGPKPLVGGDYLIKGLGLKPGPNFKKILDAVYEKQLDGVVTTEVSARAFACIEAIDLGLLWSNIPEVNRLEQYECS